MRNSILLFLSLFVALEFIHGQQKAIFDHTAISPAGFKTATITFENATAPWISETQECAKSDKFKQSEKREQRWLLTIDAQHLNTGVNNLFICAENEQGQQTVIESFQITRDDTIPQVAFDPPAGEFGSMPAVALKAGNAQRIIYTLGDAAPVFDAEGKPTAGDAYSQAIKPTAPTLRINARAISAAGVVSTVASAEYRENRRLKGWNSLDIYVGALYLSTVGSVKSFLPSGVGALIGLRYGLDDIWSPKQNDINARPFYLPGAWAELQYLRFDHAPYSENIGALVAGPEWQLPITSSRNWLFTFGVGVGAAQLAVKTPTYEASALTTALAAKTGVEWQLGALALSAQVRYAYFADQASPLSGVGISIGILKKV